MTETTVVGSPPPNHELAAALAEVADLLTIKGEVVYKSRAYRRAAEAVATSTVRIAEAYVAGDPPRIEGVGATISDALAELSTTGRLGLLDKLRAEVPPGLRDVVRINGVGPRTARLLHEELGVASMEDLRRAAESGSIRKVRGMSERSEQAILEGIAMFEHRSGRMLLDRAEETVERLRSELGTVPGVERIVEAGSFRRRVETIGDIDLLVEAVDAEPAIERLIGLAEVAATLARGERRCRVRLGSGAQVDLLVMPPGAAGPYLIHLTGSKEHNVRLRARARDRGWSLSEFGFAPLEEAERPGRQATHRETTPVTFGTEAEAYAFLDLPFIEPELREDRGEIEAAETHGLPRLVELGDLRGDLHSHSDWTDGTVSIEAMAEAARARGLSYLVLTDHTMSLGVAGGLDPDGFARQREIVAALNERFAGEEAGGTAPSTASPDGFRLLHGCELEIRADGGLDLPDEVLARFDLVVASLHVGRRQPRERLTERVLTAVHSPHVDVIAHPSGRKIDRRPDLDLDWPVVYEAAARTGTVLEVNGSPDRLDLAVDRARAAAAAGCLLSIDSDAHRIREFEYQRYGTWQARRAWVEPVMVVNTRSREDLLAWVAGKPDRVA
jgi:DNA polymerase (family 10)